MLIFIKRKERKGGWSTPTGKPIEKKELENKSLMRLLSKSVAIYKNKAEEAKVKGKWKRGK